MSSPPEYRRLLLLRRHHHVVSPEFRRPHDPATSERQQRSALCGEPVGGHACSSVISTLKLSLVEPVSTTRTLGALYRIATQRLSHGNRHKRQQQSQDMCWSTKSYYAAHCCGAFRVGSSATPSPLASLLSETEQEVFMRCLPSFLERDAIEGEIPGLLSPETSI